MEQLYIGGLGEKTDEAALRELLAGVAGIDSAEVVCDLVSGKPAGYGVVRVSEAGVAEALARLDGAEVGGQVLNVSRMPLTLHGEMPVREYLHMHAREVLEKVGVNKGNHVLDYGCGPGIFSVAAAQVVGQTGKISSLDVRERALQRVREKAAELGLKNFETIQQTAGTVGIPLVDSSVDVVIIYDVLHDIADKPGLFREARRVLRPQGFLSVFPMHWGKAPLLNLMEELGLFRLRDSFIPPNSKSPSHILNFTRIGA